MLARARSNSGDIVSGIRGIVGCGGSRREAPARERVSVASHSIISWHGDSLVISARGDSLSRLAGATIGVESKGVVANIPNGIKIDSATIGVYDIGIFGKSINRNILFAASEIWGV